MKKKEKKDYFVLAVLLVMTVILTFSLANIYKNKEKYSTNLYETANKITANEFDEFMMENSDAIIYISDKFDLRNEKFEIDFNKKLEKENLSHLLVYLDKKDVSKKVEKNFKNKYNITLNLKKIPIIIFKTDGKIEKVINIEKMYDIDSMIDYEVYK